MIFAKQLIGKSATEYHYELVAQCADTLPSAAVLKKIKSQEKLKKRNAVDPWEDLRLESNKGQPYIQFRGECPLMLHLYTHAGMRLYSGKKLGTTKSLTWTQLEASKVYPFQKMTDYF